MKEKINSKKKYAVIMQYEVMTGAAFFNSEEKAKEYLERCKIWGVVAVGLAEISIIVEVPGVGTNYLFCIYHVEAKSDKNGSAFYNIGIPGGVFRVTDKGEEILSYNIFDVKNNLTNDLLLLA